MQRFNNPNPYLKVYVNDIRARTALALLHPAVRWVWLEIRCIMASADVDAYGVLRAPVVVANEDSNAQGSADQSAQPAAAGLFDDIADDVPADGNLLPCLPRLLRWNARQVTEALRQLTLRGLFAYDEHGFLFDPQLQAEWKKHEAKVRAGQATQRKRKEKGAIPINEMPPLVHAARAGAGHSAQAEPRAAADHPAQAEMPAQPPAPATAPAQARAEGLAHVSADSTSYSHSLQLKPGEPTPNPSHKAGGALPTETGPPTKPPNSAEPERPRRGRIAALARQRQVADTAAGIRSAGGKREL